MTNRATQLLDTFKSRPSLANARKLINHLNRFSVQLCQFGEDDAGMIRNAARMAQQAALR
jgi:hypothetical protein